MNEQMTEMLENAMDVLRRAGDALEAWGARDEVERDVRTAWFELHQTLDPHCTCTDCLAAMDGDEGIA